MSALKVVTREELQFYQKNGYLVLKDFVSIQSCETLKARIAELLKEFEPGSIKSIFSTQESDQNRDEYFLDSGNKIRFFFEKDAFESDGTLKQSKELSINKIGHALHDLDPVFRDFSYQPRILGIAKDLGLVDSRLLQSMYIFKQPKIGGEVNCHQDGTFLYTEPETTLGFWFALEDATQENGCLWAIPGGHEAPLKSRYVRDPNGNTRFVQHDLTPWDLSAMVPLEVPKGCLILLHSRLPHMSYANQSSKSRHAYTLHFIDSKSHYPSENWLRPE